MESFRRVCMCSRYLLCAIAVCANLHRASSSFSQRLSFSQPLSSTSRQQPSSSRQWPRSSLSHHNPQRQIHKNSQLKSQNILRYYNSSSSSRQTDREVYVQDSKGGGTQHKCFAPVSHARPAFRPSLFCLCHRHCKTELPMR